MEKREWKERVAEIQHKIWASWMKGMFESGGGRDIHSGIWLMHVDKDERWHRQMNTAYAELSEREKDGDRDTCKARGLYKLIEELIDG